MVQYPSRGLQVEIGNAFASGGMAMIYVGWLKRGGGVASRQKVAIKRLHPHLSAEDEFRVMFLEEAGIMGAIRHPNVVPLLDVIDQGTELCIVMEYVDGEAVSKVLSVHRKRGLLIPVPVACRIIVDALRGLQAAHEARDKSGNLLDIVHRDVSPQNILIGADGRTRVLDFGIAKSAGGCSFTQNGHVKGKPSYMAPEQILGEPLDRRTDLFAAGVVLWEMLTTQRLFQNIENCKLAMRRMLSGRIDAPSRQRPDVPASLDAIVCRALAVRPDDRFSSAEEMANAIEELGFVASTGEVADWLTATAADSLRLRRSMTGEVLRGTRTNTVNSLGGNSRSWRDLVSLPVTGSGNLRRLSTMSSPENSVRIVDLPSKQTLLSQP